MNESTVTIPLSEYMKLQDEVKEFNKLKDLLDECTTDTINAVQTIVYNNKKEYIKIEMNEILIKDRVNIKYKILYKESLETISELKGSIRRRDENIEGLEAQVKYLRLEYSTLADKYDKLKDNIPSSFIDFIKYKFKNEK